MDGRHFDAIVRTVAAARSRRQVLRMLLGSAAGVVGGTVRHRGALPATATVTCRNDNLVTVPCAQLNDYIRDCGVICPDGGTRLRNHGGCTQGGVIKPVRRTVDLASPPKKRGNRWCAKRRVTIAWEVTVAPQSTLIDYQPGGDLCCPDVCQREVAEVIRQLTIHEEGHVAFFDLAAAEATGAWQQRLFNECDNTPQKTKDALDDAERRALRATEADIRRTITTEPPQARLIDCAKCAERQAGVCPSSSGVTCATKDECCADYSGQYDCLGGQCCLAKGADCTTGSCCSGNCQNANGGLRCCPPGETCPNGPQFCYC